MCGIFGYVGTKKNTAQMILDGLKTLEYRGYDSWGISIKHQKAISSEKHVGKIGDASTSLPTSTIGIGHTRWATHGGVTERNAHPHTNGSKTIAVVHNGIVENYAEIKKYLLTKGYKFITETDTEVIPHLIDLEIKKGNGFATAVKKAFNQFKGLNAMVVLYAPSKEIICVKSGSPLVIGRGKNEFYLASDAVGILKYTRELYFLDDGEMAILAEDRAQLLTLPKGVKKSLQFYTIDWDVETATLGSFPHFLIKEIHEQPRVIRNIALNYGSQLKDFAGLIRKAFGTFFIGCGTAAYACLAGTYIFSRIAKKHINFAIGSEFSYLEDYLTNKSLVVPISQSGETIDVVQPIQSIKKKGAKIGVITNVLGSTLYRLAEHRVLLNAGPEKAVISTKAFTAMVAVLLYTAYILAGKANEGKALLEKTAKSIQNLLLPSSIKKIRTLASFLAKQNHMYILGRGLSYPASLEFALKMKETSYIHAEGFAGGELKHGVIALVEKGTPIVVLAPLDETYDEIISNAQEVKARGGLIIGISPKPHEVYDTYLAVDEMGDATLILEIVVSQLLAYYTAIAKGFKDPDKPRNLAKSVTVK